MLYVAKPNLNNSMHSKTFDDLEKAVAYLEACTGHKMDYVKDPKTKEKIYDWEILGKLKRIKA